MKWHVRRESIQALLGVALLLVTIHSYIVLRGSKSSLAGVTALIERRFHVLDADKSADQQSIVSSNESRHVDRPSYEASRVHIVFSTDCSRFMQWQSLVLLDSAARVGQRGVVTRLVAGCHESSSKASLSREEVLRTHARLHSSYPFVTHIHFTRDFNSDFHPKAAKAYFRFANKPMSILDWLEHHGDEFKENHAHNDEDVLVVCIDPDFVFLRPLDLWTLAQTTNGDPWDDRATVRNMRGKPTAQQYGLGAKWLEFHLDQICGRDSPCLRVTREDVLKYYNCGPPYVLHWLDFRALARSWVDMTPKFWDDYPNIDGPNKDPTRHYTEMYAYAASAAHLDLRHTLLKNLMIGCMSGWRPVDDMPPEAVRRHQCVEPPVTPAAVGPYLVHYCQRYSVGRFFFGKRTVPHNVLDVQLEAPVSWSDSPTPPSDLFINSTRYASMSKDGKQCDGSLSQCRGVYRNAFLICTLNAAINGARRRNFAAISLSPSNPA